MERRQVTVLVASVALATGLVSIWLMLRPATPKFDATPIIERNVGLGQVLAEETAAAIHDKGRIVLVTAFDHDHGAGWRDDAWKAFQQHLKQHPGITIDATEIAPPNPAGFLKGSCPIKALQDILKRRAQVDAIVFFVGLPDWTQANGFLPSHVTPKILVADDNNDALGEWQYSGYFANGFLTALLYANGGTNSNSLDRPKTPREWFDRYYRVYTPQNYDSLPKGSSSQ